MGSAGSAGSGKPRSLGILGLLVRLDSSSLDPGEVGRPVGFPGLAAVE